MDRGDPPEQTLADSRLKSNQILQQILKIGDCQVGSLEISRLTVPSGSALKACTEA